MSIVDRLENAQVVIVDLLTLIAPWFASVPSAWALGAGAMVSMGVPAWVAVALGATFLTLDPVIVYGVLALRRYNQSRPPSAPSAPVGLALVVLGVYVGLTMALMALLQHGHPAMLALPPLGLIAMASMVLHRDQRARVSEVATLKQADTEHELRLLQVQQAHELEVQRATWEHRRALRAERAERAREMGADTRADHVAAGVSGDDTRARVLAAYLQDPDLSTRRAGQLLGLSSATVSRHHKRLVAEGELGNGHRTEVEEVRA